MVVKTERKILTHAHVGRLVKTFQKRLHEARIPVADLFIFGSYVSGRAHRDSDIDVAVVVPSRISVAKKKKLNELSWIAKQVHIKLEPHVLSTKDVRDRWMSFPSQVRKYGKRVQ